MALCKGKHVLCESPIAINIDHLAELRLLAKENKCILMDSIKTAFSTAYYRMLLLAKSGVIGRIISVDAVCTSLSDLESKKEKNVLIHGIVFVRGDQLLCCLYINFWVPIIFQKI